MVSSRNDLQFFMLGTKDTASLGIFSSPSSSEYRRARLQAALLLVQDLVLDVTPGFGASHSSSLGELSYFFDSTSEISFL
jgi:hypothetical protein